MILLGITGAIGHGKSTLADMLTVAEPRSIHLESFYLIAEIADAWHVKLKTPPKPGDFTALNKWIDELPAILKRTVHTEADVKKLRIEKRDLAHDPFMYQKLFEHLDHLRANPGLSKHRVTDENKQQYRPVLQWLGGYLAKRVDPALWHSELVRRAKEKRKDYKLAVLGGVRFPADAEAIQKAGGKVIRIIRPNIPEPDMSDPTEREREHIMADIVITNDGTLPQLERCAQRLLSDLQKGRVKTVYRASEKT